ncbi:uncharacterized protein BBOV_IV009200 [Babesia bovis T2Bo]|uniref:Uncharacterized protein n=1 Tax=Babesia bovis TaxID=5865 RepID=A7ARV5_BABBO|nr:uncharacterized protein BBOV_IV009200 [Babesia bovis T2Bo]EDO07274.1 hypothetical protein BBOV_IV009200 [Babesia bovis T2Bo]|eukprot:XP_001610842.1 hypothetical protein [Babesia bovis T2Bo]
MKKSKNKSTEPPTVEPLPSTVEGTMILMEQRCTALLDALKASSKECSRIGSGMRTKFNELMQNITNFTKSLSKAGDEKVLLTFPTKLSCCVLLEAITFANNKTKPLVTHISAIHHLYTIIDFLYHRSVINHERKDSSGIPLENNELYIYIDMLFKMFETISKLSKVDESVHLRTVQTLLQTFSSNSLILLYEDICRRSLYFLDSMLAGESRALNPIVEGGFRQLVQCILGHSKVAKRHRRKFNNKEHLHSESLSSSKSSSAEVMPDRVGSFDSLQIVHIDLVLEILNALCLSILSQPTELLSNLKPGSSADVLLIAIESMPKGVLFDHPRLQPIAKEELYSTVRSILTGQSFIHTGSLILAKIMEHGYYYCSYGKSPDRALLDMYASLYNFVEMELIETTGPDGLLRVISWMRGFLTIMQSNEMLDDMCHHRTTRSLIMEILKFVVKRHRMVNDKRIDHYFEGIYKYGDGHQLLSDQIDLIEPTGPLQHTCIKFLPIFAVELVPGSVAMDFANMTNGVIGKLSRILTTESMDMQQLELVESALAIDTMLTAAHMLYSSAMGMNRNLPCFAPYRIFYPKVAASDPLFHKPHDSAAEPTDEAPEQWPLLKEVCEILLNQFERMLNVMRSSVMQDALIAVLQALLVVCSVFHWDDLYHHCVKALMTYVILVERQFAANRSKCLPETWSMYLMHIRCLNALLLNYPKQLHDVAWSDFMERLIAFFYISWKLGVCTNTHLKDLVPVELDELLSADKSLHEDWEKTLSEIIEVFDRLRVHDLHVLNGFMTHLGFHVVTPLLAKSGNSPKRSDKLEAIKMVLENWQARFINKLQHGDRDWDRLLEGIINSIDNESILMLSDPEFLRSVFNTIIEYPHARQLDVVMMFTCIMMELTTERSVIEGMVQAVCRNIVSLCLAGHSTSNTSIDAGLCLLYKVLTDNATLSMDVINGMKMIVTTVPQIFAASNRIMDSLAFATKHVVESDDMVSTIALIDVFAVVVEDSVDFLQDQGCIQFVECAFILANRTYTSDSNAAFRAISLCLDFAEKMAARSFYFGVGDAPREREKLLWSLIFTGMKDLGCSEYTEIRQCAIKSLSLFIKGRLNKFDMELWILCCDKMLIPLADGLLDSLHHISSHQTVYIICDELYVAFKDCLGLYRDRCEDIMGKLILGLEKVVQATIGNKLMLPNELNSSLSLAIGIVTNIIIDYCQSDFIWDKCLSVLQTIKERDIEILRQNFFKSVCNIVVALGEREDGVENKLMQVIKMSLGDQPCDEAELTPSDECSVDYPASAVIPPWIFPGYEPVMENDSDIDPVIQQEWDSFPVSDCPYTYSDHPRKEAAPDSATSKSPFLSIYATLKLADDPKVKFTLRDKIQNSMGILQEMQLLQLVSLHYNPQMVISTDTLNRIKPLDVTKQVPRADHTEKPQRSSMYTLLSLEERVTVIGNIMTHIKEPPLFSLIETYSPVSKLFRCLGTIKSPGVYSMLLRALINRYLFGSGVKVDLALQLVDRLVASVREILVRFLTEVNEALTRDEAVAKFTGSKVYRLLIQTILPMVPMIFEVIKATLSKHTLQPVAVVLYQSCINLVKYVYLGLYVVMHFIGVDHLHQDRNVLLFWRSLIPTFQFFTALNYTDELETRVKYLRILHAVAIDAASALVVNPFSIAPPFIYSWVARILDSFADGQSAVLRRIALQRLCDAASSPFIPSLGPAHTEVADQAVRLRTFLTKRFFFVLSWHVRQFLRSTDSEIDILAALQLLESNSTLPNELIFDSAYMKKHRYLKFVQKRPLVSLAMPYLLDLLESDNKRVLRATRRILALFLEEMGAQVTPL